jgi:hypothetical protein
VVRERLSDRQEDHAARRIGLVGVARRGLVARDDRVARRICVVHEEETVRRVLRVERQTQQSPLVAAGDDRGEIQERPRLNLPAGEDDDPPGLEGEKEARVASVGDRSDRADSRGEGLKRDFRDSDVRRSVLREARAKRRCEQQDAAGDKKARPQHSTHRGFNRRRREASSTCRGDYPRPSRAARFYAERAPGSKGRGGTFGCNLFRGLSCESSAAF